MVPINEDQGVQEPLLPGDDDESMQPSKSADETLLWAMGDPSPSLLEAMGLPADHGPDLATQGEGFFREGARVLGLATPVVAGELLAFCSHLVTTAQAGALGASALSAFVVASTVFDITGLSIVFGLGAGLGTFTGQAYGAGKYGLVGVYLQRACAINLLVASLACLAWWWGAEVILSCLGQDADVVPDAAGILRLMGPSLVPWALQMPIHSYFSTQGVVMPMAIIAGCGTIITPFINYLFIYTLGYGIYGIALAYNTLACLELAGQLGCMVWLHYRQPRLAKTWSGFNLRAALSEWPAYLKIALPSMAMICLDWWCFEVVILVAGLQPNAEVQLAAMGILFTTHSLSYTGCSGLGTTAATRVSNELGANHGAAARRASLVCGAVGVLLNLCTATTLIVFAEPWARLYTPDNQVVHEIAGAMPFLALSVCADSINAVGSGVLCGTGKQLTGTLVNLMTFWGIGIPMVYKLSVVDGLGARGAWMALAGVSALQACVLLVCMSRFNWQQLAAAAQDLIVERAPSMAMFVGVAAGPGGHHLHEPIRIQRRHSFC